MASLESSIRTCKIDAGFATNAASQRFLNGNDMVCPVWGGYDSAGRPVCPMSYNTKTAGCTSALDRVSVENSQRPSYFEYVNLNPAGLNADIYIDFDTNSNRYNTASRAAALDDIDQITGNFGLQLGADVNPKCGSYAYTRAMAQNAQDNRFLAAYQNAMRANNNRCGY